MRFALALYSYLSRFSITKDQLTPSTLLFVSTQLNLSWTISHHHHSGNDHVRRHRNLYSSYIVVEWPPLKRRKGYKTDRYL